VLNPFLFFLLLQQGTPRTIAIDERLAADAKLSIGDRVFLSARPESQTPDTIIIGAIVKRSFDPAEVARSEYRIRLHLDQLQSLTSYGDRVDRFAVATKNEAATQEAVDKINSAAFGFEAHRSKDIAIGTSKTFQVVSRFHKAIGVITIVASAVFLLCIMVLKVEERRRDVAALRLMGISRRTVMRAVVIEATLLALVGSALGVGVGWVGSQFVNWYYRGVYRTPLAFSLITPSIVTLAVALSIVLGITAGVIASLRLVRTPPLVLFGR
jgi:putative ABC transport system permease protein